MHEHKPAPKYSPTLFKSKVITKEEKADLQKKEDEKKKIEERGIAFAKTFINNKAKDTTGTSTAPRKPFVKRDTAPRTEYVPYYKRPRTPKVKKAVVAK